MRKIGRARAPTHSHERTPRTWRMKLPRGSSAMASSLGRTSSGPWGGEGDLGRASFRGFYSRASRVQCLEAFWKWHRGGATGGAIQYLRSDAAVPFGADLTLQRI